VGELVSFSPIIPFRHCKDIARQIAWDEANRQGEGKYCLANNNCEHYAHSRVFGLHWSRQVAERPRKALDNAHRKGDFGIREPKCDACLLERTNGWEHNVNLFRLDNEVERRVSKLENYRSQEIER
jgi:hypothetical protein